MSPLPLQRALLSLLLPALLCWPLRAHAQSDDPLQTLSQALEEQVEPTDSDPHAGRQSWQSEPPEVQADRDPQLAPAATGAIFVPSLTDGRLEPQYIVRIPGGQDLLRRTGTKAYVLPGTYEVLVGSGSPESMLAFDVTVVEGRTTFVPVEWGGLVIAVVNERGRPFRGTYELVTMPNRKYVGLGLGALLSEGERLSTWFLAPGTYLLVTGNESYQARRNFATLRIIPGQLIIYTIVVDQNTGELKGAGEVSILPESAGEGWDYNVVVGGSGEFNSASNVVGKSDGEVLSGSVFFESTVGLNGDKHFAYGRFNLEVGGRVRLDLGCDGSECDTRPFFATVNEMNLDMLYVYRLVSWFGPYSRASFRTRPLPGIQEFSDPQNVRKIDTQGNEISAFSNALETQLSEPFAPITLEAGTGPRIEYNASNILKLNARAGLGMRQFFALGLFVEDTGLSDDVARVFREVNDITQFGIESAVILELNAGRWIQLQSTLGLLAPFDDFNEPVIDFRGNLALRLTSIVSINYTMRVIHDVQVLNKTQLDQSVLLRFAYRLL
jgi:hypothetical protein